METIVIGIGGMQCQNCVHSVCTVLEALPGVYQVEVSLPEKQANVTYDPGLASIADFKKAIDDAGFDAS